MSSRLGNAEGRAHSAPADRQSDVEALARHCLELAHHLRDLRDNHAGELPQEDVRFLSELAIELPAYGAILPMSVERQVDWLAYTIELAARTSRRVSAKQGGVS